MTLREKNRQQADYLSRRFATRVRHFAALVLSSHAEKNHEKPLGPRKSCREKSSLFEITSQESLRNQLPVETSYCRFCRIRLYCDIIEEKGNLSDVLEENTTNYMDAVPRGSLPAIAVVSTKTNRQKPL